MKILIYGQSKSGTTILHARVRAAFQRHVGEEEVLSVFEPRYRSPNGAGVMQYQLQSGKIKDELPHTQVKALFNHRADAGRGVHWKAALDMFADFDHRIFINRDPRDRLISGFFYRWYAGHKPDPVRFQQALQRTRFKEKHPAALPFFCLHSALPQEVRRWSQARGRELAELKKFLEQARASGWHLVRYEDIVDGNLDSLDACLGFRVDRDTELHAGGGKRVARSKRYGNWRQWFTEEDVTIFRPVFEPYLELLGYDPGDWRLEPVDSLPSEEGSEYMIWISKMQPDPEGGASTFWQRLRRRFG